MSFDEIRVGDSKKKLYQYMDEADHRIQIQKKAASALVSKAWIATWCFVSGNIE